jgi:hypothetical protein
MIQRCLFGQKDISGQVDLFFCIGHPWLSSVYLLRYPKICQVANIWNPDFQYMPGIYHVYPRHMPMSHQYAWYIRGISMYILCISNVVDIRGISKDKPCISTEDIRGISLYIHGISVDVYTWYIRGISMYIPSFLFLDFLAGPCCWSHSMRTLVLVIKIGIFHAPPWQLCHGKRRPTKGSSFPVPRGLSRGRGLPAPRGAAGRFRGGRLGSLVFVTMRRSGVVAVAAAAAAAAAAAVATAVSCGGCGGGGGGAGFFPGVVAFNDLWPCQCWG